MLSSWACGIMDVVMAGVAVARGAVTKEGPPLWEDPDHMSIKEFKTRRAKDLGETQSTISSKAPGDMTSVVRSLAGGQAQ